MPDLPYLSYLLPSALSAASLEDQLAARLNIQAEATGDVRRVYLDTFDWRLYRAGGVLQAKQTDRVLAMIWEDRRNGQTMASCRVTRVPGRPAELPTSGLREQITSLVEMRTLLPLAQVQGQSRLLRVLNDDQKTVVRLRIETARCRDGEGRSVGDLAPRLTLVPVKGYAKAARQLADVLEQDLALVASAPTRFDQALALLGRVPGDYSSKLNLQLDPQQRADEAVRQILRHLLDTLVANVPGTRADLDSKFLHDLRVATRRTRSALNQIKGVLPAAIVADYQQRFGWLSKVTGPTRDLDVFILGFADYRRSLPAELRGDLDPLLPYLQAHQRDAQQVLRRKLDSPHCRRLLKQWRQYLDGPPAAAQAPGSQAALPIRQVASARLWRIYQRVLKEGRAIGNASPAAELHELRKSCKKLRYLLEFFASLYPAQYIKPLLKQLKRLLDNLGEFQDLEVQAHQLRAFGEDLQRQAADNLPVVLAIGTLIGDLLRRQGEARAAFSDRFADFDDAGQLATCRALFHPAGEQA